MKTITVKGFGDSTRTIPGQLPASGAIHFFDANGELVGTVTPKKYARSSSTASANERLMREFKASNPATAAATFNGGGAFVFDTAGRSSWVGFLPMV